MNFYYVSRSFWFKNQKTGETFSRIFDFNSQAIDFAEKIGYEYLGVRWIGASSDLKISQPFVITNNVGDYSID